MANKVSLLLALTVNKLLPVPQSSAVGIGYFRVACPLIPGNIVSDQTFTVATGTMVTRIQPSTTLVIRTDQQVTVTLVKGSVTNVLIVDQLLAITSDFDSVAIRYDAPEGSTVLAANVSLIQS